MSTKNLIRSMKENGQPSDWQYKRRLESRQSRKAARQLLREFRKYSDESDLFYNERWNRRWTSKAEKPRFWGYDEKHGGSNGVLARFLRSHVGQHWDDVYSELAKRYNLEALACYDTIRQHIHWLVDHEGEYLWDIPGNLVISHDGILIETPVLI